MKNDKQMQSDQIILSEMKPNTIIENSSDLDLCDIDQNYNWTGNIK